MEITTFPATINCPGKYVIVEDIEFSSTSNTIENLITVNACDVSIDLMGHTLSISDDYKYKNRWFNLIYSKHSICVNNGILGRTSGYSIKCSSDVHCNKVIFNMYELGAILTDKYVSLTECTILSPNTTQSTYAYDYSRRMITVCFDLISNHSNALPITVIGQLSQYMATLENLLDFVYQQYRNGINDLRFFTSDISYRSKNVINGSKVKICNSTITIPNISEFIYTMEKLTNIATNNVVLDIGYYPIQYLSSVTIPELSNVVWYSGYLVNTYNLPYYRMPQDILDSIKNLQNTVPTGYNNVIIQDTIVIVDCKDIKIYDTTMTVPSTIISILINNSRYVRCVNCTLKGIFRIISTKSLRITSSNILQLEVLSASCLELSNNIIGLITMYNLSPNVCIKSK